MGGADRNQFPRLPGFQKSIWISQLRDNKNGGLGWYRYSMGLIPEHPSPTNNALIGVLDTFSFNTVPQRCGMRIYSKILAKDHLHHQITDTCTHCRSPVLFLLPTLGSSIPPAPSSHPCCKELFEMRKPLARRETPVACSSAAAPLSPRATRPLGHLHAWAAPLHALRSAPSGRCGGRFAEVCELIMGRAKPAVRLYKELTETYCMHCTSLSFI